MLKVRINHDWSELAVLASLQSELQETHVKNQSDIFLRVDTECISDFVLQNTHLHSFFKKLPILEKYYEFIDKRVAKCKEAWMKFFRPYKANMCELAEKIKAREERLSITHNSGYNSMTDESSNPLCTDLFALLRQSKMTEELLNFITDDLHDTEILARLNVHC